MFLTFSGTTLASLPVLQVSPKVSFDGKVKKQIEEQLPAVCSFSNCTYVLLSLLNCLGYEAEVKGDKVIVVKSILVKRVKIEGLPSAVSSLRKTVKLLLLGKPFSEDALENVKQLLLLNLRTAGYRDSNVRFKVVSQPDGYTVEIYVSAGLPFIVEKVVVDSPARYKKELLSAFKQLVGKRLDASVVKDLVDKLEEEYIKQGYFNAYISYSCSVVSQKSGKKLVILKIKFVPGKRYRIEFKGNEHFPPDKLKPLVTFYEAKSVDEFEIERSKERIKKFYEDNGFPFVKVESVLRRGKDFVVVEFKIDEGKQVVVKRVVPKSYQEFFKSLMGKPFSRSKVESAVAKIRRFFKEKGFLDVKVSYVVLPSGVLKVKVDKGKRYYLISVKVWGDFLNCSSLKNLKLPIVYTEDVLNNIMDRIKNCYKKAGFSGTEVIVNKRFVNGKSKTFVLLSIYVFPGEKRKFGFVIVEGLERTGLKWIRKLIVIHPGEIYKEDSIINQYSKLANTRLFSMVSINDYPVDGVVNEVISLREGSLLHAKGFVGYGTDSGYVMNGFLSSTSPFGLGVKYFLFGNYRQKEGYDAVFKMNKPAFPFERYDTTYSIVKKEQIFESFTTDKIFYRFALEREASKVMFQSFGIEIARESIKDTTIHEKSESVKRTLFYFQRYDKRDNVKNPKRGYLIQLFTSFAGRFLGGNTDYWLVDEKALKLFPINEKIVVALREGAGLIQPIRGSYVPVQDRFFLGGAESVRGYKYGTISPTDSNGNYVGGEAYGLFSCEVRYNFTQTIQGAVFYDSGKVFRKGGDFSFGNWYSSVGVGFRYITPVGPLRIDYGYKLKEVPGQGKGRFHISFGFPF